MHPLSWLRPILVSEASKIDSDLSAGGLTFSRISTVAAAAEDKQSLIDALTTLQVILPLLPSSLHPHIEVLVPGVVEAIKSSYAVIRNAAGKALAVVCRNMTEQGMKIVLDKLLPLLGDTKNLSHRQGTMEAIWGEL